MLPADCIKRTSSGKPYLVVQTPSKREYRVVKPFGAGGVGKVYLVLGKDAAGKVVKYVLKEYPKPADPTMRQQQRNIQSNLRELIARPVLDENDQPLTSMVGPIEMVAFPKTGTFGYVMDYVDLSDYLSVVKIRSEFPECDIACQIAKNVSHFFFCLSRRAGKCYKDINEGNIYLNPKTGSVRIIDNDNVGDPSNITISGTGFYMAPEVQTGECNPDRYTDRFSLATYLYRLFVGGLPYEGVRSYNYMNTHNQNIYEAASVIFGSDARFVFDPGDRSNAIEGFQVRFGATDDQKDLAAKWAAICKYWSRLPVDLQNAFIATFAEGSTKATRQKRLEATQWFKLFDKLEHTVVKCPHCHRKTFGGSETCYFCGHKLKMIVCKQCGEKTSASLGVCYHCGKNPKKAPEQGVNCPHCNTLNKQDAQICTHCKKYIVVTCAKCGKQVGGLQTVCPHCQTQLYKECPRCGRKNAMSETVCLSCHAPFRSGNIPCNTPGCGRLNLPGATHCAKCGASLHGAAPAQGAQQRHTITLSLQTSINKKKGACTLLHTFGAGQTKVYCLNDLDSALPPTPLFDLLYSKPRNLYALRNQSGTTMRHKAASASQVVDVPHGKHAVIGAGDVFAFGPVQFRIASVK